MKHFLPPICISAAIVLLAFAIKYPTLVFPMLGLMVIVYALLDDVYFAQDNMKKINQEKKEENDNDKL